LVGSFAASSPSLNTLPVCSTIRVDSTLCIIVCNLKWKAPALYSLNGLATIMTYCVNPTRIWESFKYKRISEFVVMMVKNTYSDMQRQYDVQYTKD